MAKSDVREWSRGQLHQTKIHSDRYKLYCRLSGRKTGILTECWKYGVARRSGPNFQFSPGFVHPVDFDGNFRGFRTHLRCTTIHTFPKVFCLHLLRIKVLLKASKSSRHWNTVIVIPRSESLPLKRVTDKQKTIVKHLPTKSLMQPHRTRTGISRVPNHFAPRIFFALDVHFCCKRGAKIGGMHPGVVKPHNSGAHQANSPNLKDKRTQEVPTNPWGFHKVAQLLYPYVDFVEKLCTIFTVSAPMKTKFGVQKWTKIRHRTQFCLYSFSVPLTVGGWVGWSIHPCSIASRGKNKWTFHHAINATI